jgi:hypothetical protein
VQDIEEISLGGDLDHTNSTLVRIMIYFCNIDGLTIQSMSPWRFGAGWVVAHGV